MEPIRALRNFGTEFLPAIRSGAWADIGFRSNMEDVYICVDNFVCEYGLENILNGPNAFYGVILFISINDLLDLIIRVPVFIIGVEASGPSL